MRTLVFTLRRGLLVLLFASVAGSACSTNPCEGLDPYCNNQVLLALLPLAPVVSNVRNGGVIESGFLVGTASRADSVQVAIDGGGFQDAVTTASDAFGLSWKFALPTGSDTWRENSRHTVRLRGVGALPGLETTLVIGKGRNKDVNGDGYADLIAGAPRRNAGAGSDQGVVYIFYSTGSSGVTATSAGSADVAIAGQAAFDRFGNAVSAGDVNGDGYADVIASSTATANGTVYIFHSTGPGGVTATTVAAASSTITGQAAGNQFGAALSAGDINGDGYADLLVGSYQRNAGAGAQQGAAYVFHSSGSAGIAATTAASADTNIAGQTAGDRFAWSIVAGDVNGDGFGDLVVGAPRRNAGLTEQGVVYVFHSTGAAGITQTSAAGSTSAIAGDLVEANLGTTVAVGDMNGDGLVDVVAGAPFWDSGTFSGAVYVFHSTSGSGITATSATAASTTLASVGASQYLGYSLAVGDVNGDGFADILAGTPFEDPGVGTSQGAVYIYHSRGATGVASGAPGTANVIVYGQANSDEIAHVVAAADINGDGFTDLIAGAPVQNAGAGANQGAAYVFHSTGTSGITATSTATATTRITAQAAGENFGTWVD